MKNFVFLLLFTITGLILVPGSSDTMSGFNHADFTIACSGSRSDYNFTTYSHFLSSTEDKRISSIGINSTLIQQQKLAVSSDQYVFTVIDTDSNAFVLILEQPFIEFHVSRFFTDRAPPV